MLTDGTAWCCRASSTWWKSLAILLGSSGTPEAGGEGLTGVGWRVTGCRCEAGTGCRCEGGAECRCEGGAELGLDPRIPSARAIGGSD